MRINDFTAINLDPESRTYYYRARVYNPELGRFQSKDPLGFAAGDLNLYRYVGNDPVRMVDPSGECTLQLGVSGSGTLFGTTSSFGFGLAFDDKGNITTYYNYGGGIAFGAGFSAGTSIQFSNANTIFDLAGSFVTTSIGAGEVFDATIDLFGGYGTQDQPVTGGGFTFGVGLGGSAGTTYGPTILGPVINPFDDAQPQALP